MKKRQSPAKPDSGPTPRPRELLRPLGPSGRVPSVILLWETHNSRIQLISRIMSEDALEVRRIEASSEVQDLPLSVDCRVAVVALGGMPLPNDPALEVVRSLRQKKIKIICYEDNLQSWPLGNRCQALLAGAHHLLDSGKPEFQQELRSLLGDLLKEEARKREEEEAVKSLMKNLGLVGVSEAMISVFWWILRVSKLSDLPILITGETGTGKELAARAIYQLDPKRRNGPFVPVNCGAISSTLAESELFGHRRGAFTGADQDRKGLIRSAHDGVLFLDEIGELELALQTKLLRALQENRVLGVGEDQEVPVSVRVIAASNRDLSRMIRDGTFREDLFHRLNVLSVHIPPLRERRDDVEPLVTHFLKEYQSLNLENPLSASPDFIGALRQVELPGNARQLENFIRHAFVNKDRIVPLTLADLPLEVLQQVSDHEQSSQVLPQFTRDDAAPAAFNSDPSSRTVPNPLANLLEVSGWNLQRSLQHCERLLVESALRLAHGNQSQTARLLGITPRSVYNKVRKHHLPLRARAL